MADATLQTFMDTFLITTSEAAAQVALDLHLAIYDANGNKLVNFSTIAAADNYVEIENSTSNPTIRADGADTNIDLILGAKGTGDIILGNFTFDGDQTVGAGQDNYVLTYDNGAGLISLEAAAGGGISNIVEDTTPQLGGMLDVNGQSLGDGTLELLSFSETGSAVNEFTIANAATGNGPELQATGGDSNIDIELVPKGTGLVKIGSSEVATAQHYRDICIPAGAWLPDDITGPEIVTVQDTDVMRFDDASEETMYYSFRLPDDYNGGVFTWRVNWTVYTGWSASQTVVFGLAGTSINDNQGINQAYGTERTITDTATSAGQGTHYMSPADGTGITVAGTPVAGDSVRLKFVVKTTGTNAGDADIHSVTIQYQTKTTQPGIWT